MALDTSSLLIVEDNPADITLYLRLLEDVDHGFEHIECVTTVKDASDCLENNAHLSCCLLDFNLPDGSALSLLESLQSNQKTANCPIVVITGQEDTKNAVRLLKLGVQDYIVKDDLSPNTLIRTIQNAIQNWKLTKQLEQMAHYDALTGLTNRGLFLEKLEQSFNESIRYSHHFALILLDLDKFKSINDIYGHEAGDFVLSVVGQKLDKFARKTDIAGRLGGDEFAIILPQTDEESAHLVVDKLLKSVTFDVVWRSSVIPITASIGVAMCPGLAKDSKKLMRQADIALYRAKDRGRAQYVTYNENEKSLEDERERLKNSLPNALLEGKLQVAFQPIFSARDNDSVYAIEALTRWNQFGKWINPIDIINLVMELGVDIKFHGWLLKQAFTKLKEFQVDQPNLKLCLNLPANICHNPNFSDLIIKLSAQHKVTPNSIILEITETHLMTFPEKAKECLLRLVEANFHVAIDDFGTGYSSMEYIADLPCSILKIDKKFFLELEKNHRNSKIIEAICALAHGLDMQVIAEGIENELLCKSALALGCDYLQGFHLGYPAIPSANWNVFLSESASLRNSSVY
jgi:diguanylate cyclase (GGDEF)-like protein